MPDPQPRKPLDAPVTADRRASSRYPVRPTEYIEVGDANGGIILDIGEGGMAVATAQALVGHQTLRFRFQLPGFIENIEAFGEISWIGETKKRAGVRFVDLSDAAQKQILDWIERQTSSEAEHAPAAASPAAGREQLPPTHSHSHAAANGDSASKFGSASSYEHSDGHELEDLDEDDPIYETSPGEHAEPTHFEHRSHVRRPLNASTYLQLDDGNAGLVEDLSEAGLSFRAAKILDGDNLSLRFQLPGSDRFIETEAWIVWKSASKKKAGARFENLPSDAQTEIAAWIGSQTASAASALRADDSLSETAVSPEIPLTSASSLPIPTYISPLTKKPIIAPVSPATPVSIAPPITAPATASTPSVNIAALSPHPATQSALPSAATPTPVSSDPAAPVPKLSPTPYGAVAKVNPPSLPTADTICDQNTSVASSVSSAGTMPSRLPAPYAGPPKLDLPPPPKADTIYDQKSPVLSPLPARTSAAAVPSIAPSPLYTESAWYIAPKKPLPLWKIVAAIVLMIAGTVGTGIAFYRSRPATVSGSATGSAASPAQASEQGPVSANTSAKNDSQPSAVPPSPDSSTSTPPVATAGVSATPHVAAGAIDARKKTGDAQFVDEPRHPQFVDEPRPASSNPSQRARSSVSEDHAQSTVTADLSQLPPVTASGRDSLPPPSSTPSASQSSPPGASRPTSATVSNSETANRPSGSEVVTPRNQNALAATPSNTRPSQNSTANGQPTTEPVFADANAPSSAASVTPAAATAAPAPAPAQNLAGSVSFFSRFRSIRAPADSGVAAAASTGVLQLGPLLSSPVPSYPPEALRQQVQGVVELDVFLGVDGKVQSVHLVKGPAELAAAAMGAVRAWRYGQTVVGGRPMETEQSIFFTFKLSK